jgi:hypothetical protein
VDGGGGVDTLKLDGAGLTLDLTSISNTRIQDIEIIDIRGSGDNSIVAGAGNEYFIAMGACECVGVFITEIINGVLGIATQFC